MTTRTRPNIKFTNRLTVDFFAALNRKSRTIETTPVTATNLGALLDLITDKTINGRIAKEVFEAMVETGEPPAEIIEAQGLRQVTDTRAIDAAVDAVLAANPDNVADYKSGKKTPFDFFVGQIMKAMAGKSNPGVVNDSFKKGSQILNSYSDPHRPYR